MWHVCTHSTIINYSLHGDIITIIHSLSDNRVDDAGAQTLAGGLKHCANIKKLE